MQFEKAASILSSHDPPVVLAKVDANEEANKELALQYDVKGYPTIKILRKGGKAVQEYNGPREADGIVEYLKKQSGPASAEIKTVEDASGLVVEKKIVVVSFLASFALLLLPCIFPLWFLRRFCPLTYLCRLGCSQN